MFNQTYKIAEPGNLGLRAFITQMALAPSLPRSVPSAEIGTGRSMWGGGPKNNEILMFVSIKIPKKAETLQFGGLVVESWPDALKILGSIPG